MKNIKYIKYLSACMLFPIFFGCQQELKVDGIGSPVLFTVATGYEPETKTEFSGDITGTSSTVERIDWVNGDKFRVNDGALQSTDLTVSSHSDNDRQSVATVSGTSLVWEDASTTFYALYPAPATGNSAGLATNVATGTIPSAQTVTLSGREYKADMEHYGYMCASATASAGSAVSLVFKPLMTAFRFTLYANAASVPTAKLTRVTLSSTSATLAGEFSATIGSNNTYTASVVSGTGVSSVYADLGTGVLLSTTNPVVVTLLALPVSQTNLTLELAFDDNKTRSIPLKQGGTFVTVPAGQKMYVNNLGVPGDTGWRFEIDDIPDLEVSGHEAVTTSGNGLDFTVTSYKYDILNPSDKVAVPWKVKYSVDGTDWKDTPAAAGIDTKFALYKTSGNGSISGGEDDYAKILIDHTSADYEQGLTNDLAAARMAAATIPANALDTDGYYDLSKHAVYGSSYYGPETTQETANCYVISRPGKYKFPAVYGNAIREDADNQRAFMPQGYHMVEGNPAVDHLNVNNTPMFMRRFLKHDDFWITTPDIKTQIGGGWDNSQMRVIWQTGTTDILEETDLSRGANDNYIYFEVKPDNIRPGNILIGLYYNPSSGEKFYVWSWHIWVTDEDLTPVAGDDYSMMKHNLGWINSATAQTQKWADWTFYVKVYQDVEGGAEKIFTVTQRGDATGGNSTQDKGNSLLYQWGRKDPFPLDWGSSDYTMKHSHSIVWSNTPSVSGEGNVQQTTNYNASTHGNVVTTNYAAAGMRAGHAIKNPYILYKNNTTHHWVTGTDASGLMGNLWDADFVSGGTANQNPLKSVYDPSPRGFVVASSPVYENFSTSSPSVLVTNEGWNLGTGAGSITTFFPFAFGQNESGTTFSDAYYWSATSDAYNNASYKYTSRVLKITGATVGTSHHNKAEVMPVRSIVQNRF